MTILLIFLLLQPSDSLVINRIQETAAYEPKLLRFETLEVQGVVIIKRGRRMFHDGEWGYPYEVVVVCTDKDGDAWVWDTAYFFYMKDDCWRSYNDEDLEEALKVKRRDT